MKDLIAFLRARLDEREARHAADWWQECKMCREPAPCWHMRDIEAKRQIIDLHEKDVIFGTDVLVLLALPDASHRDYNERWRP